MEKPKPTCCYPGSKCIGCMLDALHDHPDEMVCAGDLYNIIQYVLQHTEDILNDRCPRERDPMED